MLRSLVTRSAWVGVLTCLSTVAVMTGGIPTASAATVSLPAPHIATKKGVASRYLTDDPAKMSEVKASWAYNWRNESATPPAGVEYVPMLWGKNSVTDERVADLTAGRVSGKYRHLLGFNEPDALTQSYMTPEEAIELWPKLQSTGLRLGSPAPAVALRAWLSDFMTLAEQQNLRVDFIALHFYQDFTRPGAIDSLRRVLQNLYVQYGKPIWITEIGAFDLREWGKTMYAEPTAAGAETYMRDVTAMLDNLPFVERYAWSIDSCDLAQCAFSKLFDDEHYLTGRGTLYGKLGRVLPVAPTRRPLLGRGFGQCIKNTGKYGSNLVPGEIAPCDGKVAQQWERRTNGTFEAYGKCLDVGTGKTLAGVVLTNACSNATMQKWRWTADGRLYHPRTNRCLAVKSTNPGKGIRLLTETCSTTTLGQRWRMA